MQHATEFAPAFHIWNEPYDELAELLQAGNVAAPEKTAARLLRTFGCLETVMDATVAELARAGGLASVWALKRLSRSKRKRMMERQAARPLLATLDGLRQFLHDYGDGFQEEVLAIYVDCQSRLVQLRNAPPSAVAGETIDIAALIAAGHRIGAAGFFLVRAPVDRASIDLIRPLPAKSVVRPNGIPLMQQFMLPSGRVGFVEQYQRAG